MRHHRYHRRVEFAETDMAGLVHFSCYFKYMEEAEHALWRASGLSIAAPQSEVGFPRRAATCEFRAPLRFEDEFDVLIQIDELGERTIRYSCVLTKGETTVATGTMTVSCVGKRPGAPLQSAAIPEEIMKGLKGV
jgi:YbgC/YbaW family acyl-CoA thioester hydrolase